MYITNAHELELTCAQCPWQKAHPEQKLPMAESPPEQKLPMADGLSMTELQPPMLREYPYMLNRNHYELATTTSFAQFLPTLTEALARHAVDFTFDATACTFRCLAYPGSERVEFNISTHRRPTNGAIVVEFQRYNNASLYYAVILDKLTTDLGFRPASAQPPAFSWHDDLNHDYEPSEREVQGVLSTLDQEWAHVRRDGLCELRSMFAIEKARQPLLCKGLVPAVLKCIESTAPADTDVRRCAVALLRDIVELSPAHIDVKKIINLLVYILSTPSGDSLAECEVQFQALSTLDAVVDVRIDGGILAGLMNSDCTRVRDVARALRQRLS